MNIAQRTLPIVVALIAMAGATLSQAADKKDTKKTEIATFAGGCFWCMESPYDHLKGVKSTTSGYTGGTTKNPKYEEVGSGKTGHAESVEIEFDPSQISYAELLQTFWHNVDPTQSDGQFCDYGTQYRAEIFYHDAAQKAAAEASREEVKKKFGVVAVNVTPASTFYPAEEYHQDFCTKEPDHYNAYRKGCGRDRRLKELWGDAAGHAHQ